MADRAEPPSAAGSAASHLMKSKTQTGRRARVNPPIETGQVWQLDGSQIEIGLTGKRLVHYRHYKPMAKRPAVQLSAKEALEKFLRSNDAVLLAPAATGRAAGAARTGGASRALR